MFIDGEDDENSISTGLFLSVFFKEIYGAFATNILKFSHRGLGPLSCTASVGLGLITLQRREMNESGCAVKIVLKLSH